MKAVIQNNDNIDKRIYKLKLFERLGNWTKCLKNQPCDVIKLKEMRGEVGKKTPKKIWIISHFYDVTWMIFETILALSIL